MSDFKEHYANFGTDEPWVVRIMFGLSAIVDATTLANREAIKEASAGVYEALVDAYNDLRVLRRIEAESVAPTSERQGAYSSFYVHLWRAYKDRFQKSLLPSLGYKLGFLWKNEKDFEAGGVKFLHKHPALDVGFVEMLRDERRAWQTNLARFRNDHLEHKKPLEPSFLSAFYTLAGAELAFENVWQAIEDISAVLLIPHLAPGVGLVEIPEAERDPTMPRRFGFTVPGLPSE